MGALGYSVVTMKLFHRRLTTGDFYDTVINILLIKKIQDLSEMKSLVVNSFPNDIFFYSSNLKEFADENFKFDEIGRKLSKWVENTVGKGKIVTSNFSFSHCVFKRLLLQTHKNRACLEKD